jgi:molybdate transport system substrate-binding protein
MVFTSERIDRITGITSMATRHVLTELAGAYEQSSGQPVGVVTVGGVEALGRVRRGEAFDFVVLTADAIEQLTRDGHIVPGSRTDLVRSGVAVAVAAGSPWPDISSEQALREAVRHARNVGYSTGPSGAHIVRLFDQWGLTDAASPRLVQAPSGVPVGTLVASGAVEVGFQQLSELMNLPGIDVIGPLPREIQVTTVFSAGICTASERRAAAAAWLSFLASPDTEESKRRHGLEPA